MVAPAPYFAEDLDSDKVGRILKALGSPVRIDLLKALRTPRQLSEIKVQPRRRDGALSPSRFVSRVTVREHLAPLLELGVVRQRQGTRDGQTVDLYEVNHRQLFALTEELRQLALLRPAQTSPDETRAGSAGENPDISRQPHLALVSGITNGATFALGSSANGLADAWRIGRKRGLEVTLDYDPYLSTENSIIRGSAGAFVIEDLPTARNGTWVNWRQLPRGGSVRLRHGDVIGVGRSLLLFRDLLGPP